MSNQIYDIDEKLYERYLDDLRSLSEEHHVTLFPSLSDFSVWLQDQDLDESYED